MNRRDFVGLSGKTVAGSIASMAVLQKSLTSADGAPERKSGMQRKPNFVFILADDWGWGDLGCYGHRRLRTPNLDRMAKQGTLFTQFYVTSGVCSPTRSSFMTGLFPTRLRIHGHLATPEQNKARGMPNFLDPAVPTVARFLKQAGYTTAHFGKWHLGSGPGAPMPEAYGFDKQRSTVSNDTVWKELWGQQQRHRSSELIINETIRFIEDNRDQPFYVQAWLHDTHA